MKLQELIQKIEFEANITHKTKLGGYTKLLVGEILDSLTSLNKYDELYVGSEIVALTAAQNVYIFPDSVQHIDYNNVYLRPSGEEVQQYQLKKAARVPKGYDGRVAYFIPKASTVSGSAYQIQLLPSADIAVGDELVISYWQRPSVYLQNGDVEVVPKALIATVSAEAVGRLRLQLGDKAAASSFTYSRLMHQRSFGETDMHDANGN